MEDYYEKLYTKFDNLEKWRKSFPFKTLIVISIISIIALVYDIHEALGTGVGWAIKQWPKDDVYECALAIIALPVCVVMLIVHAFKCAEYKRLANMQEIKQYKALEKMIIEAKEKAEREQKEREQKEERERIQRELEEYRAKHQREAERSSSGTYSTYSAVKESWPKNSEDTNHLLVYAGAVYNGHYDREGTRHVIVDGRPYATANPWAKIALPSGYHTVFVRYLESVSGRIYQTDTPPVSICADQSSKILSCTKNGTYIRNADLYDISDKWTVVSNAESDGAPPSTW